MGKISTNQTKRTAAYIRVSLETERLRNSLAAQESYFTELIRSDPGMSFAGIYADSFITGTEAARRPGFLRLISDCERGGIDLVLCKSISRFARNTVDLLETVRHLKSLGVELRFEKENISTFSADGELMLTILASFAQEESRSISENVKWGIRRRFQSGNAEMRNKAVYGYRYDGGKYVVCPEEAEIVRGIFHSYIAGMSLRKIAETLAEKGAKTIRGRNFSHNAVNYIVRNELYTGDILLQKTFVKDCISHTRSRNNGELPQYLFSCRHEPIIDKAVFEQAREETLRRAARAKQTDGREE